LQLLTSRTYPFIDCQSLEERLARDSLFRIGRDKFLLHMTASADSEEGDRLIWLDCRAALLWLNAPADEFGKEWV